MGPASSYIIRKVFFLSRFEKLELNRAHPLSLVYIYRNAFFVKNMERIDYEC
jgi:hypothetical protein